MVKKFSKKYVVNEHKRNFSNVVVIGFYPFASRTWRPTADGLVNKNISDAKQLLT